jgi:hypothetical protein
LREQAYWDILKDYKSGSKINAVVSMNLGIDKVTINDELF